VNKEQCPGGAVRFARLTKEKTMYTVDQTIDTFQNTKKQFVNTVVKNEAIAKSLNDFVDAQTAYTKSAMKATQEAATKIGQEVIKANSECTKLTKQAMEQMAKNDFVKTMIETISKEAYTTFWQEAFKWYEAPKSVVGKMDKVVG
jgi:hypothetical protein